MEFSEKEIEEVKKFVKQLNSEKYSVIIVEAVSYTHLRAHET